MHAYKFFPFAVLSNFWSLALMRGRKLLRSMQNMRNVTIMFTIGIMNAFIAQAIRRLSIQLFNRNGRNIQTYDMIASS